MYLVCGNYCYSDKFHHKAASCRGKVHRSWSQTQNPRLAFPFTVYVTLGK